ncbi:unnamed protein product [Caretta caretta]
MTQMMLFCLSAQRHTARRTSSSSSATHFFHPPFTPNAKISQGLVYSSKCLQSGTDAGVCELSSASAEEGDLF